VPDFVGGTTVTALGVGILGAGAVTQAIHIPALARLADQFAVRHVMDVDGAAAAAVAARVGANWSISAEELLRDPAVDVVVICSPPAFHAAQVLAAIAAGVRGILCEKPLAATGAEAETIAAAALASRTPLIVGAMHAYDPAWLAAQDAWGDLRDAAHVVRSSIVLPPNARYEHWATESHAPPPASGAAHLRGPAGRAERLRDGMLGLAIHDIPLIRRFVPVIDRVSSAEVLEPFGYAVSIEGASRRVELFAHLHAHWRPEWSFEAWSSEARLRVDFPPSYVQAGSAVATLTRPGGAIQFGPFEGNGYLGEWRRLARLVAGEPQPGQEVRSAVDDLEFALRIADAIPLPSSLRREGNRE
jgi:predicted dehydrogenase